MKIKIKFNFRNDKVAKRLIAKNQEWTLNDTWLSKQINLAFAKLDTDKSVFFDKDQAESIMAERKVIIRNRGGNS